MHWSEEGRQHKLKTCTIKGGNQTSQNQQKQTSTEKPGHESGDDHKHRHCKQKRAAIQRRKERRCTQRTRCGKNPSRASNCRNIPTKTEHKPQKKKGDATKKEKTDASHSKRVGKWRGQEFAPPRKNERQWRRWYRALRNRIPGSSCAPKNAPKETK